MSSSNPTFLESEAADVLLHLVAPLSALAAILHHTRAALTLGWPATLALAVAGMLAFGISYFLLSSFLPASLTLHRRLALWILATRAWAHPKDPSSWRAWADGCRRMATFSHARLSLASGRAWFRMAAAALERLHGLSPDDLGAMSELSAAYDILGGWEYPASGHSAIGWFQKALELDRRLADEDPSPNRWVNLSATHYKLALLRRKAHPVEARADLDAALGALRRAGNEEDASGSALLGYCEIYSALAACDEGNGATAAALWEDLAHRCRERLEMQPP